eukprot:CAMPEP_0175520778 /NCGR_PEP_ID=MMETSP0096-20121207/16682_1 /TAXON_ID=311494 /ORGANISM="Alexandrium monilatum, Strain CCMP3105" /LENGTH=137 /DNA_ID=CAMNT_0016823201 /DNA_START=64 /DNA_END=477 /DNA_ORIENTATION=+
MAAQRPVLCLLAIATAMVWVLRVAIAPAFAGARPTPGRQLRAATPLRASEFYEIFVTNPSVGERTRMSVTKDTTVESIITESRKLLGFDQAWIPDSDFKLYSKDDESSPIGGNMGDNNVRQWGPDGTELHLMFEPAN